MQLTGDLRDEHPASFQEKCNCDFFIEHSGKIKMSLQMRDIRLLPPVND